MITNGTGASPSSFAIIIGAMKSGTTSLFSILAQHPEICAAQVKEPEYFVRDGDESSKRKYLELWNWDGRRHKVAMEASVAYAKAPFVKGVPFRIKQSGLGSFRFIYVLRDPLGRIESQARHALFAGWGRTLDEGIDEDLICFSSYAMQIDEYLKYFERKDILLVVLEEFQRNPHVVLRRICQFLEVQPDFEFSAVEEKHNTGEFFDAPAIVSRATQGRVGAFIAKKILPSRAKSWLRSVIVGLTKKRGLESKTARWKLNQAEREYVLSRLSPDLTRLETEYRVEIWKYWSLS
jgi:hypothetical protein